MFGIIIKFRNLETFPFPPELYRPLPFPPALLLKANNIIFHFNFA